MKALLAALLLVAGAVVLYVRTDGLAALRAAEAVDPGTAASADHIEATRRSWSFARGAYPTAWAWGDWQVVDEALELRDTTGTPAVYFLPIEHGSSFRLRTRMQFVAGGNGGEAIVHLGTERTPPDTLTGTGVSLFAARPSPAVVPVSPCLPVSVRHFIAHQKLAASMECRTGLTYGRWYDLTLDVVADRLSVYLDGTRVAFTELTDLASPGFPSVTPRLLAGRYHTPFLAVSNGVARFRHLEIGPPEAAGLEVSAASAGPPVLLTPAAARQAAGDGSRQAPAGAPPRAIASTWWLDLMRYVLYGVVALVCLYMARHYAFTLNRLFGRQRHPYLDIDTAKWPRVTVIIPAHNEEAVIGDIVEALIDVDYPADKLRILPVNDRSEDRTGEILDELAEQYPGRITPFHREGGKSGKSAVLQDAMRLVEDDIVLVFDADYYPGRGLIKQLVAPFFDPEVGAVMGRVVPYNVGRNLLTRTLDLERAGGYQVDQQARMNMRLVPQYGGTVGGVRRKALLSAGGWRTNTLAEDTDATMRLLLAGWKTVYQNRSECYEQVPETWRARMSQLSRWTRGHNQALARYAHRLLLNRRTTWLEKIDGLMVLNIYMMSPLLVLGWSLALALWFFGVFQPGVLIVLLVVSYSSLGNFAIFSEIAAATYLDGSRGRIRLLPFMLPCFLVSVLVVTWAFVTQVFSRPNGGEVSWTRTARSTQATEWK